MQAVKQVKGFTADELAAMRAFDDEIEREFIEGATNAYIDSEVSKWLDELAVLDSLDHRTAKKWKYQRQYYEANKDQETQPEADIRVDNSQFWAEGEDDDK